MKRPLRWLFYFFIGGKSICDPDLNYSHGLTFTVLVRLDGRASRVRMRMRVRVLKTLRGFRFALNSQHCREAASPFFSAKLLLPSNSIKNELSEESFTD